MIVKNPKLKDKLKFIGVGHHDNELKLKFWRKNFKVPFPLVPDMEGEVFSALKIPGTPVKVILDRQGKVYWVNVGAFNNAGALVKDILVALKL